MSHDNRQNALGDFDADIALFLGFFHEKRKRYPQAEQFFKLCIQLDSKSVIARLHMHRILKEQRKYAECLGYLNSIVQIDDVVPAFALFLLFCQNLSCLFHSCNHHNSAYFERGCLCSRVFFHFDQGF